MIFSPIEVDIASLPGASETVIWRDFLECRLPIRPGFAEIERIAELSAALKQISFPSSAVDLPPGSVAVIVNYYAGFFGGPLSQLLKCLTAIKVCAEFEKRGVAAVTVCRVCRDAPPRFSTNEINLLDRRSKLHCLKADIEEITKTPVLPETRASSPHFSRICGQDARAPGGFAITSIERIFPDGDSEAISALKEAFASDANSVSSCVRWLNCLLKDFGVIAAQYDLFTMDQNTRNSEHHSLQQSRMLPVAAFVVDTAEIAEYVNALSGRERGGLNRPLVWPSPDVTITNARSLKTLKRYGLDFAMLFNGQERVMDYARETMKSNVPARLQKLKDETAAILDELKTAASAGACGERSERIRKSRCEKIIYQLEKIRRHSSGALAEKEKAAENRIGKACDFLAPRGCRQSDVLCGAQIPIYYGRSGLRALYEHIDITRPNHQLIEMD